MSPLFHLTSALLLALVAAAVPACAMEPAGKPGAPEATMQTDAMHRNGAHRDAMPKDAMHRDAMHRNTRAPGAMAKDPMTK